MLKIKDNIDLKELEKFGFFYDYDEDREVGEWKKKEKFCEVTIDFQRTIYIYSDDERVMSLNQLCLDEEITVLYDLIKADLVEKVEGGN